ncbi:nicotinate-nucleotide adenylyltransferase [Buchnera aphidicola]|uniref:nicotinate-nucleotide adenylyltransferase n=1 Tax=Buchnera aphidicola TaxID=9 RepID=UPI003464CC6B
MKKIYAILGGNFNPIHNGHIYSVQNIAKEINIKKIILLPNHHPPHRNITKTSLQDKINMIKLAINHNNLFTISYLETNYQKIFYTIDTLKKIRKKIGYYTSLCFIIGEDNLQYLYHWKEWKKILYFTHLLILPRQCIKKNNFFFQKWIDLHITKNIHLLHEKPYGLIFFSQIPFIHISSSQIRKNYYEGRSCYGLLPYYVDKYIRLKKLYCSI